MVVGIGGFRDIGDPNDPRRRRGPAPQGADIPGLPAGYYRDVPVQRQITPVGEGSSLLDRRVRRAVESTGFDPRNREESPINLGTIQGLYDSDDPIDQELYNEYVRGIAAASDTVDLEANNNLRYGQFTAVDPTTGSLTAKQASTPPHLAPLIFRLFSKRGSSRFRQEKIEAR